jgi:hypothetical protein
MATNLADPDTITPPGRQSPETIEARASTLHSQKAHLRHEALERLLVAEEYALLAAAHKPAADPDATRKELVALIADQAEIAESEMVLLQEALEAAIEVYTDGDFLVQVLDRVVEAQQALWALRVSLRDIRRS